jgi:hypothetical protein
MSFEVLYQPFERLDADLTALFDGAGLLVALGVAVLLGLRHASDPDHLVAVTSLVTSDDAETRDAARLGTWWGAGHAITLLAVGLPMIALKSGLPGWLETGAERAVGLVVVALGARVLLKWFRSDRNDRPAAAARRPREAFGLGVLHGLAGSGAVALLLIAAMPTQLEAAAALAVFAPMSVLSMTACTAAFAWVIARPGLAPVYTSVMVPAVGSFGLLFGLWYAGLA